MAAQLNAKYSKDNTMREKEIIKQEVQENLGDLAHKVEQDHEIQLARGELYKAAKYSIKLHDMLKGMSEAEGLDGWVSAKITKASDYLGTVFHHLDYQTKFDEVSESTCNCSCGKEICESCGKTHKKKKVKEETNEGGMPTSVIKNKQKYADMSDKELASHFKGKDEKTLKQMAWRHGYGKMSSHYVDRVKNETYKDQLQTKLEAKKNEN